MAVAHLLTPVRAAALALVLAGALPAACVAPPQQGGGGHGAGGATGNEASSANAGLPPLSPLDMVEPHRRIALTGDPRAPQARPDALRGLKDAAVREALGPPDFTRRDGPAQIWQYRHSRCVLDLFLYRDDEAGTASVAHVEVRSPSVAAVTAEDCFAAVLQRRNDGDG